MKSPKEHASRRKTIVRRWAAYRIGQAQREIWRKKRAAAGDGDVLDETVGAEDLLAELPDGLLS